MSTKAYHWFEIENLQNHSALDWMKTKLVQRIPQVGPFQNDFVKYQNN